MNDRHIAYWASYRHLEFMAGLKLISKEDAINQMDQVVNRGRTAALVVPLTHIIYRHCPLIVSSTAKSISTLLLRSNRTLLLRTSVTFSTELSLQVVSSLPDGAVGLGV